MNPDLYKIFLEQITDECFPGVKERKIKERLFLKLRFHPKHVKLQHKEIAVEIQGIAKLKESLIKTIPMICQSVVRIIANKYSSEMLEDGIEIKHIMTATKGEQKPWQIVYNWLYDYKFPHWLTTDIIWQSWKAKAQPQVGKISFEEISVDLKKLKPCQPRKKDLLVINKPFSMQIEVESSNYYLLLLNRGKSDHGDETKYLICPSQAFAPILQSISNKLSLPQPESDFEAMEFDTTGIEEYLGILVKKKPDDYIFESIHKENNLLPEWDIDCIYPLWKELEKQTDYQVFYQSFLVVAS